MYSGKPYLLLQSSEIMKNKNARGLFDEEFRLTKLSKQGDPLLLLKKKINWELFRPLLENIFLKEEKG